MWGLLPSPTNLPEIEPRARSGIAVVAGTTNEYTLISVCPLKNSLYAEPYLSVWAGAVWGSGGLPVAPS